MATFTREQVIEERRCGIKYFDKAVSLSSRTALIELALKIHKEFPDTWGPGWPNISWALGNAVIEKVNPKGDISQTWNIDEVLTPEEIEHVRQCTGIIGEPEVSWERRKRPRIPRTTYTDSKLTTKLILDKIIPLYLKDTQTRQWFINWVNNEGVSFTIDEYVKNIKREGKFSRDLKKKDDEKNHIRVFTSFSFELSCEVSLTVNSGHDDSSIKSVFVKVVSLIPLINNKIICELDDLIQVIDSYDLPLE